MDLGALEYRRNPSPRPSPRLGGERGDSARVDSASAGVGICEVRLFSRNHRRRLVSLFRHSPFTGANDEKVEFNRGRLPRMPRPLRSLARGYHIGRSCQGASDFGLNGFEAHKVSTW